MKVEEAPSSNSDEVDRNQNEPTSFWPKSEQIECQVNRFRTIKESNPISDCKDEAFRSGLQGSGLCLLPGY